MRHSKTIGHRNTLRIAKQIHVTAMPIYCGSHHSDNFSKIAEPIGYSCRKHDNEQFGTSLCK